MTQTVAEHAAADSRESYEVRLRSLHPAAEAETMVAFARVLFGRAGTMVAAELGENDRVALVASAFRFFARMAAPVRCRIWTPVRAEDGWDSPYTILETHLTDRPFIVDTIRAFLHQQRLVARHLVHPIYAVERDAEGSLRELRSLDTARR
ncbi:MAG: hypothetical protein ACREQ9_16015, partial [Candidatus Binatia bacterium]